MSRPPPAAVSALVLVLAIAVTGCPSSPPAQPADAAPPGTPDAALPDAALVNVSLTPGSYRLSWTCQSGCIGQLPAATYNRMTYDGATLLYWYESCQSCGVSDMATPQADGCVVGQGIPQGSVGPTDPYRFCSGLGSAQATVTYTGYPGSTTIQKVWQVNAAPL